MTAPNEVHAAVLSAVGRFLHAAIAGDHTAEAMAALVAETSRLPLTNLESWEGALRLELWKVDEARWATWWKIWRKPTPFISWVDLCSGDGHAREKALRTLSDAAPNAFFFALAMRRLNDWVPEVRAAARAQLPIIASRSNPEHVVGALWSTLSHSASWGRMGDDDRRVLSDLAAIEGVAVLLKSRIVAAAAGPATAVLEQAGRRPALDEWLSEIARDAVQPSVRAKAYRSLLEGRMTWLAGRKLVLADKKWGHHRLDPIVGERAISSETPFVAVLRSASEDPSPMVRRVAGDLLIQRLDAVGTESLKLAERLASDPFPSVAERGTFALKQLRGAAEQQRPNADS